MSDTGPPRKEPPPSELRIGAPPRPVTRLSRRTLVVATALVTALVFAALWYRWASVHCASQAARSSTTPTPNPPMG